MTVPIVVMPDAELVAVTALRAFLAARPEPYCQGVTVGTTAQAGVTPTRFVRVRRIGGRTANVVADTARLDVVIWHDTPDQRMSLAQIVRGYFEAMVGTYAGVPCYGGVLVMAPQQMPDPADDTREVVMLTIDVFMRGSQLA